MIDRIIALTLEKSQDRRWFFLGAMTARGVPPEKIYFHAGTAAADLDNDYSRIARAADLDGFPFVRNFQGYQNIGIIKQAPAQMAQVWSYAKILSEIAGGNQITLVIWDDRVLTTPYFFLDNLTDQLEDTDVDFLMLQLRLRGEKFYMPHLLPLEENERRRKFGALFDVMLDVNNPFTFDSLIQRGFHGYDETIIFSPKGAEFMLAEMHKTPDVDPDIKKMYYFDINLPQKQVYNSCINIDNWICHYFAPLAFERSKTDGIYCPLELGFDFVQDMNLHGSLTDWIPDDKLDETPESYEYQIQFI